MGIKSKDIKIGEDKFTITRYNAREGLRIKIKLVKMISPIVQAFGKKSIDKLSKSKNEDNNEDNKDKPSILDMDIDLSKLVDGIINNLHEDDTVDFIIRMLEPIRINGVEFNPDLFDEKFAGNYAPLYKLLMEVIDFNHFFGKGSISSLIKKAA